MVLKRSLALCSLPLDLEAKSGASDLVLVVETGDLCWKSKMIDSGCKLPSNPIVI